MVVSYATIGFTIAGILFGSYAYSLLRTPTKTLKAILKSYSLAYFSLAVAFIVWGLATLFPETEFIKDSVYLGNALILIGSLFMVNFLINNKSLGTKLTLILAGVVLSAVFMWWRFSYFPPSPSILSGVLLFNTPQEVSLVLSLVFLLIWLPANFKSARFVAIELKEPGLRMVYAFVYTMSIFSAILFMSVKTPIFAVIAFAIMLLCFVLLLYSNIFMKKMLLKNHG